MNQKKDLLAIIPARGGSKGIHKKNIADLGGHPLIAWSIAAGLDSRIADKVVVSTDDIEIANIARKYGADVPFLRPETIAKDNSLDIEFLDHALNWYIENEGIEFKAVALLRPTSPIRPKGIVDLCYKKLISAEQSDSLRIVTDSPITPYKMWKINNEDESFLTPLLNAPDSISEPFNHPRQLLPKTYWQIGTLDVIKTEVILQKKSASGNRILGHYLPFDFSVDIDNEKDLILASEMISNEASIVHPR